MKNSIQKEQKKQANKDDILEAALTLFAKKDFHDVTVDEIADQAGLSKGTIYLYFKNKDDLFFSIIQEKAKSLSEKLEFVVHNGGSFLECLQRFIHTYLSFFHVHSTYFKIMHSDRARMKIEHRNRLHDWAHETFQIFFKIMVDFLKQGQDKKIFRDMDIISVAKTLRGILNSFTFHRVFLSSDATLDEETELIMDLFLHGVHK
jgi:AcrR family transcriptional regulator